MEIIESLTTAIESKDKAQTLVVLDQLLLEVRTNMELVKYLTEPSVINKLHESLRTHLEINQRMLMLRAPVPSRGKRALLFAQVMHNAVSRVS